MDLLLASFGAVLAFIVTMLIASLVVMSLVRVVQYMGKRRSSTLAEMLGTLNQGYRASRGDAISPNDSHQEAFVVDVMSHPALYAPADRAAPKPLLRRLVPKWAKRRLALPSDPKKVQEQRRKATSKVDYIAKDDLLRVVKHLAANSGESSNLRRTAGPARKSEVEDEAPTADIPRRWHDRLSGPDQKLESFTDYVTNWFETAEGVSADKFKLEARRLTIVFSALLVVLLNMDAFALFTSLMTNARARNDVALHAPDVLQSAERLIAADAKRTEEAKRTGDVDRVGLLDGVGGDLIQFNTLLNEPGLELGWQHSWIAKAWCKEYGCCSAKDAPVTPASTWTSMAPIPLQQSSPYLKWGWYLCRWLAGLGFSVFLLSLGAPFWADQLKNFLNLNVGVQKYKGLLGKGGDADSAKKDPDQLPSGK